MQLHTKASTSAISCSNKSKWIVLGRAIPVTPTMQLPSAQGTTIVIDHRQTIYRHQTHRLDLQSSMLVLPC